MPTRPCHFGSECTAICRPGGTPVTIGFIATIPPLSLEVGQRYQWRVSIADETHGDWLAGITVTTTDT